MASYLVTGSSRGLGFNLALQLASRPESQVSTIFAAARSDSLEEFKKLVSSSNGRVKFVQLDVTDKESIKKAVQKVEAELGGKGLDVLINNAGIIAAAPNGIETMDDLDKVFATNVLGVHMVTAAFLPLLRKGSKKLVANISTTVGSFGLKDNYFDLPVPAYKVSKAGLNMLTLQYANQLEKEGFIVVAVSPGWLKTEGGGGDMADLPTETGTEATLKILDDVDKTSNGKFLNIHVPGWENAPGRNQYPGGEAPW